MKYSVLLFMGLTVFFNSAAHIAMKYDTRITGLLSRNLNPLGKPHISILFTLGALCFATSIVFYRAVLKSADLSIAYSVLTSGAFIVVIIFSFFVFHEKISAMQGWGLLLLFVGLFMVLYKYSPDTSVDSPGPKAAEQEAAE